MPEEFGGKSSKQAGATLRPATIFQRREPHLPASITPNSYSSGPRKATEGQSKNSDITYKLYNKDDFVHELTTRLNNLIAGRREARQNLRDSESAVQELRDEYVKHQRRAHAWPREQRLSNDLYWARSAELQRRLEFEEERVGDLRREIGAKWKMDVGG